MNSRILQTKTRLTRQGGSRPNRRRLLLESLESRRLLNAAPVLPRNIGTVDAFVYVEQEGLNVRGQNDSIATAEFVPLGNGVGRQNTIDITGNAAPATSNAFGSTPADVDFYRVSLDRGDILDIAGTGSISQIHVFRPNSVPGGSPVLWFTANGNTANYPVGSPLQTLGSVAVAQSVPATGDYFIQIVGGGLGGTNTVAGNRYSLGLRSYRPALSTMPQGTHQTVLLDFDGGTFNPASFFPNGVAPGVPNTLRYSSLEEELTNTFGWTGNSAATAAFARALQDEVVRQFATASAPLGLTPVIGPDPRPGFEGYTRLDFGNGNVISFGHKINGMINGAPGTDPGFNAPAITRVLVGQVSELRVGTQTFAQILNAGQPAGELPRYDGFGIAQGIDVGNFVTNQTVVAEVAHVAAESLSPLVNIAPPNTLQAAWRRGIADNISHKLANSFGIYDTNPLNAIQSIVDANRDNLGALPAPVQAARTTRVYETLVFGSQFVDASPGLTTFPLSDQFARVPITNGVTGAAALQPLGIIGTQFVAHSLVSALPAGAGTADTVTGRVLTNVGVPNVQVFVDLNGNGVLDIGEPSTLTNANGEYSLNAPPGASLITVVTPAGFEPITPTSRSVTGSATGVDFRFRAVDGTRTGVVFADLNGNGTADSGEPGISDIFVYIDLNRDGQLAIGDPRARTDANGNYTLSFAGLQPGTYTVRQAIGAGFEQTAPAGGFYTVTWDGVNPPRGLDFGNRPSRDFGDAPDSYMTLQASGGPSHGITPGLMLGQTIVRSLDGQPSPLADADPGDDGVRVLTPIAPGSTAQFEVFVTNTTGQTGFLQAWFDFNQNGTFTNPGEQVLVDRVLSPGSNIISVNIPSFVQPGDLFTRWRYSLSPGLGVGGPANTGEVEDHRFTVQAQARVANDDLATVSRNSQANRIDVLANDFETPDNRLRVTAIDRFSLGTRGVVTVAPDGRSVFYTPPTGFVGQDRFTYTVTPEVGPPATATVTVNVTFQSDVPIAVDDTFEVAQGSNNIALNVLDNDIPSSQGGITIVSVTPGTEGGTTSLAGGNQSVRYTPRAGFAGTEQFTYTISDAAGNVSSATATVNLLPGSRADDIVGFGIEFLDVINNQPISNIQAGTEFLARVTVEDLRSPILQTGVFSAFLDVLYTDELVAVVPDISNPLGFDIRFGSQFQSGPGLQSGDANTPGLLNEVGSQRPIIGPPPSGVEGPLELFTVRFQAISPGIAVFAANPADDPVSETTVFGRNTPLAIRELRLGITELVISPSGTSFTSAIDDAFPDGRDSLGNPIRGGVPARLDVLANDLLGPTGTISEFFLVNQPSRGIAAVSNGFITYTPDPGTVNRFDSFTYSIVTADGVRSTAEVTLFVGDPIQAQNQAPVGAKPFDVDINLRVVDGAGNPVSQVSPGSRFGVQVIVQDLRAPLAANPLGVFAAFTDILYDAGLARPSNQIQGDPFDFDVIFAPEFGVLGAFGIADRPGIIDEFGSFLTNTNPNNNPPNPALTGQPVVMATLFFDAIGTGTLRLVSSPADALPFRDTLLFQPPAPVPVERIRYNVTTVTIGGGSGEGEALQNALLPADVNGDGLVTPIDALLVINSIGQARAGASGETAAQQSSLFADVNGDGQITPLDALHVINHIRRARTGEAPADLSELSALTPSAGGVIPVQSYAALNTLLNQRYSASFDAPEGETVLQAAPAPEGYSSQDEDDDALLALLADDVSQLWH